MHPRRAGHGFVHDFGDPARRFQRVQPQADGVRDRRRGLGRVERDRAAREPNRIDPAKRDIGVRDRRVFAAPAIARRAWLGARGIRAHDNAPQRIDARDRAAARADFHHVDHRNAHGNAAALGEPVSAGNLEVARMLRGVVVYYGDFRRRSAHIERHCFIVTTLRRHPPRQNNPARWAAFHQPHRKSPRRFDGANTAGRHHQQQRTRGAKAGQALAHVFQISRHQRQDIGVGDGGGSPFVFADLPANLVRQSNRQIGQRGGEKDARPFLMRGVDVAVEETDRQRLDFRRAQDFDDGLKSGFVQGQQYRSIGGHAFRHL